jgi:NADPH-dependent glutamate synthase beta subunit-like oxidoreductase
MIEPPADVTPLIDLLAERGTGPTRTRRPVYEDLLPPCNQACPAGENIQGWLEQVRSGRYREAWLTLTRDNPFPAIHGRVCYHPCETRCNRGALDSAVSIHAVERFLGDLATQEGWQLPVEAPASGKRVLVVGAGPSGLSAAYHLARLGHAVEIRDAGSQPGGMLHFGIPAYRLPREVLMQEVRRIEAMGVKIVLGHKVEDLLAEQTSGGGGNTAMDAARTAKRLGAEEAVIVYHRDRAHMPAHAFEADEALEEGVRIQWLTSIKEIAGPSLRVERMELDPDGRPQPTGQFETLEADAVVLALGQQSDSGFLRKIPGVEFQPDGTVVVAENMMTAHPGIFAGGDLVPGERSVTAAVGHGKKAARHIDAWLHGGSFQPPEKHRLATFDMLNLPIYSDAEPKAQQVLPVEARAGNFTEVLSGLGSTEARYEAQRCLSCGNCFECDQCYAACPEQAIEKLGPGRRYRFLYDRCTGCEVCYETCPTHAISIIPEPVREDDK